MAAGIERGAEEYSLRGLGGFCVGLEDLFPQAHRRIEYSSPQFAEYIVDRLGIALQALSAILAPLDGQGDDELILIRSQLEDMACCRSLQLLWQSYRDEMDSQAAAEEGFRVTWVSANATRGRPRAVITGDQLTYLRSMNFSWSSIAELLGVSRMTVYRRRRELGIHDADIRVEIDDSELQVLVRRMREDSPNIGEAMVIGQLHSMGYHVPRNRVRDAIRITDPINTALRWRGILTARQPYSVASPNSLWHIGGCLLPVLLGLIIVLPPLTTGQPRAFQGSPNDRTVFVDERANFSCVVADSSVHWRVNETDVDDLPGDDIVTEAVEVGGLHVYTMVLPGRIEYNQTRIKCVFTHTSGTLIESDTAILTVVPYKEEREDNQNDLFDEQSDEVPTSSTPPDIDMIGENGNKSSTPSGEGSDHAGIITGGVIGAVVAVLTSITVIVVLFNRKKICGDKLVFCKDKWLSVEQEEEREGFRVIAEVSTPGEDYEEKATVEEPHSDKHTSIEVEESTRDGVWTSKLEESSNEGKAEVVGVHRIVRQTARTLSTERAMLSEDMPEGKHGPYISAPTLQEHISISIDEETDDMELQDLSVPREKDPQGSLATVSGKETFPRVPSSSNIQSYLNKPPLNGAKKDDSVLNDYRSSVPAASSKARDRKASFPQECSETIVHIDGSERIVCIPSGSSPINQAVQGHEHDDNLDITVEKGTSAKATVDENDTDASGDLPSPNLSSSEGEAEHSQRPNGTVTTDDLACGHESDASVNETKGQAKSVSSSQDADMVTHGTSSDLLNEDCSGCHIKCNNRISAAVSAELQGHTAIETASCEEPCASVNKVSPPSKKSQLTSDVIVPG